MIKMKNLLSVGMIFVVMASTSNIALASTSGVGTPNTSSLYFMNGDSGEISPEALTKSEINKIIENSKNNRSGNNELAEKLQMLNEPFQKRQTRGNAYALGVKMFKQDTTYYCGPATVKQTLHYINGSSSSQDTIASAIGTTTSGSSLSPMVKYINKNISGVGYVIMNDPSKNDILKMVEYSVKNEMPTVCRLKFSKGGNWKYGTSGHFLNANGYYADGSEIAITDPYIKWIDSSAGGGYWVTTSELYSATHNHFAQEMAY